MITSVVRGSLPGVLHGDDAPTPDEPNPLRDAHQGGRIIGATMAVTIT